MAQELRVKSGVWSAKGNFTARTALGKSFFVHKNQMAELGYAPNDAVAFPFYAVVDTTMIGQLDQNGDPKVGEDGRPVLEPRVSALSVFKTLEDLQECVVEERTIGANIESAVQKHINSKVSTSGLTDSAIKNILANATSLV